MAANKLAQAKQQVNESAWRVNFDDRQNKEIDFCIVYRDKFNHGTDGHILRTIIADMASMLNSRSKEVGIRE